jgi:hypothetical protein
MSVESFYYCSDLEKAGYYWELPLADLNKALSKWLPIDNPRHNYLYTPNSLKEHILPQVNQTMLQYSDEKSLQQIWHQLYGEFKNTYGDSKKSLAKMITTRKYKHEFTQALNQMTSIVTYYPIFVQLSRQGPVSEVADVGQTDYLFPEILETWLPKDEARKYIGDLESNIRGVCVPEAFFEDTSVTMNYVLEWIEVPCLLDPERWFQEWSRLDEIPDLWATLASKGIYEKGINQLKDIKGIAKFALDHDLALIKEFC